MRRIVVANQKGGVAKTTTAINLAAEIARAGKKVLLIDMDPQNSATSSIFGAVTFDHTIYDVLVDKLPIHEAIQCSKEYEIDVVPSDILLSGASMRIAGQMGREKILYYNIYKLKYDFLIIDAPPTLGLLTVNSLTACNELIVPICPEFFSLRGIRLLEEVIESVKNGMQSDLSILGVLITRYRERIVTSEAKNAIKDYYGKKVFKTIIPENIKVEEAHHAHRPLYKYFKKAKGAEAYRELAKEVLEADSKTKDLK